MDVEANTVVTDDGGDGILAEIQLEHERTGGAARVGVHDDVVGGLADRRLHVVEELGVDLETFRERAERSPDERDRLWAAVEPQRHRRKSKFGDGNLGGHGRVWGGVVNRNPMRRIGGGTSYMSTSASAWVSSRNWSRARRRIRETCIWETPIISAI